jgi:hypothetical protein
MIKISQNEQETLQEMENYCQLLIENQQLSEIIEEDRETDYEKTLNKHKFQKGQALTLDSRNVMSLPESMSSSNLRNIGNGLCVKDETTPRSSM